MACKAIKSKKISFIGAGNMAFACITGLLSASFLQPENFYIYDVDKSKYDNYIMQNVKKCDSIDDAVEASDIIVLAVKPQHMSSALASIRNTGLCAEKKRIFVSFAAGVSTSYIVSKLGYNAPVIRTMPNTPFLIGKGTMAAAKNDYTDKNDFELVCSMFAYIASVTALDESMMNKVISLNGSSPAYVFRFFDAMMDAAKAEGFSEKEARELILSTFDGSVAMLRKYPDTKQLIKNVTSPNGTTQASMESLDSDNFAQIIERCMERCTSRANELAESLT
ncbi:MAG TPA: pyrroline-5-carboxylate reductase [Bacillota bacterium]|nr:pyrroline-5-carboxylate reductase [Bacillota bacterium]